MRAQTAAEVIARNGADPQAILGRRTGRQGQASAGGEGRGIAPSGWRRPAKERAVDLVRRIEREAVLADLR